MATIAKKAAEAKASKDTKSEGNGTKVKVVTRDGKHFVKSSHLLAAQSKVLDLVANGTFEQLIITRKGEPVAVLSKATVEETGESVQEF